MKIIYAKNLLERANQLCIAKGKHNGIQSRQVKALAEAVAEVLSVELTKLEEAISDRVEKGETAYGLKQNP